MWAVFSTAGGTSPVKALDEERVRLVKLIDILGD
jgi:hypothetical protein